MVMVGLTGGIGAGKSAVAARLRELGALVIDSDQLARDALAPGSDGAAEVVATFGADLLGPAGELDRAALGRRVFGDPDARKQLEQIVHPRVRVGMAQLIAAAPPDAIVVNDIPLLVEAGLAGAYQLVIVVLAPESTRLARLARDRGMSEEEARSRMAVQATDEQRRAVANVIIDNDGSLDDLRAAVDSAWRTHILPLAADA